MILPVSIALCQDRHMNTPDGVPEDLAVPLPSGHEFGPERFLNREIELLARRA